MASSQISAVSIKKLWYKDEITSAPTIDTPMQGATKVENVHQDTWTLEESEPSQDSYKNQLTGLVYRMGRKEMGEITANFTIGRYDYVLKQAFMGGSVIFKNGLSSDDKDVIAAILAGSAYKIGNVAYASQAAATAAKKSGETVESAGTASDAVGWSRARGSVEVRKTLYALTDDDQLCVLPYVNLNAHEGDSDGAIGIVIQGMALDPRVSSIMPEYWFDCNPKEYTVNDEGGTITKKTTA